jgi:hypothetical protein
MATCYKIDRISRGSVLQPSSFVSSHEYVADLYIRGEAGSPNYQSCKCICSTCLRCLLHYPDTESDTNSHSTSAVDHFELTIIDDLIATLSI